MVCKNNANENNLWVKLYGVTKDGPKILEIIILSVAKIIKAAIWIIKNFAPRDKRSFNCELENDESLGSFKLLWENKK